ncbi:MAG: diacylglycerol kinase family protein [Planctomycetota bacterium]|nr:diacylglycerol kinase family protein [Planctomycetota bacterium]
MLLENPNSGRGLAATIARTLADALTAAGHRISRRSALSSGPGHADAGTDLVVVVGGDGSVHHALDGLIASGIPVFHAPLGTENLFARQFAMAPKPEQLLAAIHRWQVREVDVGRCHFEGGSRRFTIMASFGPDASVIHRLHAIRRGPISHASYVWPSLREAVAPRFEPVTLRVDGKTLVEQRPGMLVVANSRQYAMRIDPASPAAMDDGLLDAVFLPASTSIRLVSWLVGSRFRRHLRDADAIHARGKLIEVVGAAPCQLDGEAFAPGEPSCAPARPEPARQANLQAAQQATQRQSPLELRFEPESRALRVLLP